MSTSFPPIVESDSHPKLSAEIKGVQNIFVTQSQDTRQRREETVSRSAVTEIPSKVLETGLKTLKNTQVVRKQAELDEVDIQLAVKRQEFKNSLETLNQRRFELETRQQQAKEKTIRFEKFVAENETKRHAALKKCQATREQNILKQREIENLTELLKQLRARKVVLTERMAKFKIYEDYLMKTLDYLPGINRDSSYESLVIPVIRRHETLSVTYQNLLRRLAQMEVEFEQGQRRLQSMKQERSIRKLMANKEVFDLQSELEILKEKNKQAEVNLMMEQDVSRAKVEERGRLLMAVNNLAQQCYLPAYGPLESMDLLTMMDMVKDYILDKADTERRARRMMGSSSTTRSTAALTDKRIKALMKSTGSKTQIKSSSRVSKTGSIFI